jgi:hypothetical protein
MPIRTWVGTTDGDFSNDTNWVEGVVPITGDNVYVVSGEVDIDGSDQSAILLASLTVGSKYTGLIGTLATKLQIDATVFDYAGKGTSTYIEGTLTTVTVQNTSSNSLALNISGATDTIDTLRVLSGSGGVNIASSCNITTTIEQIGASGVTTNIALGTTIGAACSLKLDSGRFEMNEAIPAITIFGGELVAAIASGTVTTLDMYGGRVRWNPTAACTITTLAIYTGKFDSRDSLAPVFTVINTTLHENGIIDERSGLENASWTSPLNIEGGEVKYDTNRQVTIT